MVTIGNSVRHRLHDTCKLAARRNFLALSVATRICSGTSAPVEKYISSGVCPAASQNILDFCVQELVKLAFSKLPLDLLVAWATIDLPARTRIACRWSLFSIELGLKWADFGDQYSSPDCRTIGRSDYSTSIDVLS